MGYFPSGVTIVTTWDGDEPVGSTINAFCSVSLEPPLLLICLDLQTRSARPVERARVFGVNILPEDGGTIAQRFAREPLDRPLLRVRLPRGARRRAAAGSRAGVHRLRARGDPPGRRPHDRGRPRRRASSTPRTAPPLLYHRGQFPQASTPATLKPAPRLAENDRAPTGKSLGRSMLAFQLSRWVEARARRPWGGCTMATETSHSIGPKRSTWTHIALCVKDIDKSIAWYERFTHLTLLPRGEDKDGKNAWLGDSSQPDSPFVLVLGQFYEGHDPFAPAPHLPDGPVRPHRHRAADQGGGGRGRRPRQGRRLPRVSARSSCPSRSATSASSRIRTATRSSSPTTRASTRRRARSGARPSPRADIGAGPAGAHRSAATFRLDAQYSCAPRTFTQIMSPGCGTLSR